MSDSINRQTAIDAFRPYAEYESNRSNADWVRRIELVLSELPSAEPDHWIFCKDQMPPMGQYVLICASNDVITTVRIAKLNHHWLTRYWDFDDFWVTEECEDFKKVIAWMPLPSPPNMN